MQMNTKDKFRGSIVGFAVGDCLGSNLINNNILDIGDGKFTEETQQAICIADAIKPKMTEDSFATDVTENLCKWFQSQSITEFSRKPEDSILYSAGLLANKRKSNIDFDSSVAAIRAFPVGLYFYENIPQTIQFSRTSYLVSHSNNNAQVAAVASALMVLYGAMDVPSGLWAGEVISFASGIDNEFVKMIRTVSDLASKYASPKDVSASFLEGSRETVSLALYCCMTTRNFKDAIMCASKIETTTKNSLLALVGAMAGVKYGFDAIPDEWKNKIESQEELLKLADKIFTDCHGLTV